MLDLPVHCMHESARTQACKNASKVSSFAPNCVFLHARTQRMYEQTSAYVCERISGHVCVCTFMYCDRGHGAVHGC